MPVFRRGASSSEDDIGWRRLGLLVGAHDEELLRQLANRFSLDTCHTLCTERVKRQSAALGSDGADGQRVCEWRGILDRLTGVERLLSWP